ncbi:MAG: hypothetical protein NC434_09490 [Ruminococcus sp.]|nr:hypothetical protein [Ruminococcus sp.]
MPNNGEIIERGIQEFMRIQTHMLNARAENAVHTYDCLKDDYLCQKAILASLGVNLTDIDKIKE